ncbi:MAG: hypothetical protein SFU55_06940 [Methylophilus sp.]|nr:hypothetical protein [Methylophilus sp.]
MKKCCTRLLSLMLLASCPTYAGALPAGAQATITKVHTAAKQKDTQALKKLMVSEFIWSFGGDRDATQAIQAWQADKHALAALAQVTSQPCVKIDQNAIECPHNAHMGYRAGFKKTPNGWRMEYFVEGD